MALTWPDRFPAPILSNYNIMQENNIARTQMDSGLARQRRRFTSPPTMATVRLKFEKNSFTLFQGWYKHNLNEGADWFEMPLFGGEGTNLETVRFLKPYKAKPLSHDMWEVSATLEVREMTIISEADLETRLGIDLESLQQAANRFHSYVHISLPNTLENTNGNS